ncbi:MAG: isoprenylcysteine carboxylmethyltransferase family protein [Anaerolineales bacterium]|nr:isoprenylcysteine carboxylmethyltransferase family protein [Anaerolineae bacterium]PWB69474.1 MAG: isoprenylcysteine carboxylmethyltransferase family protein [Anaerolineales bacterium]
MSNIKWKNVPVPPIHVVTLILGIAMQVWLPLALWQAGWQRQVTGWSLLLTGVLLALWATTAFEDMDSEKPGKVITSGPYAFSRNPMYVAWILIYLAIAILVNTWWLIVLVPIPLLVTHFYDVQREERRLEEKFGEAYRQYRSRVRRYL